MIGILLAVSALAQDVPDYVVDIERFRPTDDATGTAVVHSAETLGHLQVGVGLWGNYSEDSVVLERGLARVYLGDEPEFSNDGDGVVDVRSRVDLQVGLGLFDRFSLAIDVPLFVWQEGFELAHAFDPSVSDKLQHNGIGDPRVTPKVVLLDHDISPLAIAILSPISLPLAPRMSFMGEGAVTANPMLALELADHRTREGEHWVRLTLNGGWLIRERTDYQGLIFDDALSWGGALGISPGPFFEFGADIVGLYGGTDLAQNPVEVLPWMKFRPDRRVTLTLGGGFGVLAGVGAPDARVFVGGSFQPSFDPKVRDRDRDGVVDKYDICPLVREDLDGYQDDDGCPEWDDDNDGVDDRVDRCPAEPEDRDGYLDTDGCPDLDNDGDGIPDTADRCPDDPETLNGFQDADGCPDTPPIGDRDGDGFIDANDRCPNDPEDFDSWRDEDGCPDYDNDGDGIGDLLDQCPREAEDRDGVADEDGCPETDADADGVLDPADACPTEPGDGPDGCPRMDDDGDGVLNDADRCPDEPETMNGFEDDDGCPDEVPPQRVFIRAERIVITDKIHFQVDEAIIEPVSFSLLDEIAALVLDHPEIARVEVQGHTDADGSDAYNLDLSQRRADAVVAALIERGVEPERLVAKGFGESVPIAPNDTPEGKARNRRVEFYIRE